MGTKKQKEKRVRGVTKNNMEISLTSLWLIIAVICGALELFSLGLTTIWFALAALFAWIFAALGYSLIFQLFIFIISSAVLIYFTRPFAQKVLRVGKTKTNVNSLIGEIGIVIVKIEPLNGTGQVKVSGQIWSASSHDKEDIEENEKVEVLGIEGVKLIVKKVSQPVKGGDQL